MTLWLCATCMNEYPDTDEPPQTCPICTDERQYVPPDGQAWTHADEISAGGVHTRLEELEPDLYALTTTERLGIGQRGLVVRTPEGNLLWEPPGLLDPQALEAVASLGPVRVISASHPHLVGASVAWSHSLAGRQGAPVPILKHEADLHWITRPDPMIIPWKGVAELLPGVRVYDTGGHFPGSALVHWESGANGRGALLTGDTIAIGGDRASVNAMRSYVNNIPLPEIAIRRILSVVAPLTYDRIYAAFAILDSDAQRIVNESLERYIRWIRGDVDDF